MSRATIKKVCDGLSVVLYVLTMIGTVHQREVQA